MSTVKEIQRKLKPLFTEEKAVLFAYIFGSAAQGKTRFDSDVDLALYLDENLVDDLFQKRLTMIGKVQSILQKTSEILILNQVKSIFLKFVIIKEGKVIFERDHGIRVDFELRTMQEYYDFQPFLEEYNKAYIQRNLQQNR